MSSSNFFWRLLSSLGTGPSFISISLLVLELWKFSFIWDLPEIRKLEIPPSEFCSISGDWCKLGIQIWHGVVSYQWKPTVKGEVKLLPLPHPSRLEINMKHEVYFVSLEQHWFYFKCPLLLHLYVPGSRNIQNEDLTVSSSKTWFLHTVNFKNNPWKAIGSSFWLLPITSWR